MFGSPSGSTNSGAYGGSRASFSKKKTTRSGHSSHLDVEVHLEDDGAGLGVPIHGHQAVPVGPPELACAAHHAALDDVGLPVGAAAHQQRAAAVVPLGEHEADNGAPRRRAPQVGLHLHALGAAQVLRRRVGALPELVVGGADAAEGGAGVVAAAAGDRDRGGRLVDVEVEVRRAVAAAVSWQRRSDSDGEEELPEDHRRGR
jgi:hypothetical protein